MMSMNVHLQEETCITCGVIFWITKGFFDAIYKTNRNTGKGRRYYCPNGHSQYYSSS